MPIRPVLAALAALLFAIPAAAQEVVGTVVGVTEGARLDRDGERFALAPEVSILSGDIILTDATGTVQLLFRDETRVVVGPGSQFVAADIRMRRSGRAQRFTVATIGGTFRFLSGNSAGRVYDIRTPTATMGIRGTAFDFALDRRRDTTLVTFLGEVQICGAGRRCYAVTGSCATVRAGAGGVDPRPIEAEDQTALLDAQFPFTRSQEALGAGYRTDLAGCRDGDGEDGAVRPAVVRAVSPVPPTRPPQGSGRDDDGGGGGGATGGGSRLGD
ncbi:MAG: FecR domain-containing protein [Paracoccaceae bacterium]|nr:FecR domain-containing protein [Paracoccaceae bacterium]